ncbi:DUF1428 domain-containing protein [Sphingomonas desiccabilis]|uniref:DUF1428 domain-containing protein n=2 Tax=Sphingomonas desiccabilis TaxID=429134 RepID=A0A4Q2IV25_9SPHN|nr:uncharacterized protein YbaA (DUF1428 family) [Sphingomonas desiccabilis]RXZ34395.1 DUF1428 domain-containing protein [Sphingomonas desiccabilis]
MTFIQGFVAAVPTANRDAYRDHAAQALPLFKEFGARRMVEAWGDDVPDGTVTDFRGAVQAKEDETVVFSWIEYADQAAYDAALSAMMDDPRMEDMAEMPFDGSRMIFAGFDPLLDEGPGGTTGYVDGFLIPVAPDQKDAFFDLARRAAPVFLEHGATRVVEAWGDDLPDGKLTDFNRATKVTDGEKVVFAWIEWPSREVRDAGQAKVMADPRMQDPGAVPFDGKRMIFGGFLPILDQ